MLACVIYAGAAICFWPVAACSLRQIRYDPESAWEHSADIQTKKSRIAEYSTANRPKAAMRLVAVSEAATKVDIHIQPKKVA